MNFIKVIRINRLIFLILINKHKLLIRKKSINLLKKINKSINKKSKIPKYYQNHLLHKKDRKVQINNIQKVNQKQTRNITIKIQNLCKICV